MDFEILFVKVDLLCKMSSVSSDGPGVIHNCIGSIIDATKASNGDSDRSHCKIATTRSNAESLWARSRSSLSNIGVFFNWSATKWKISIRCRQSNAEM